MTFYPTKPVQTRAREKVRILATDLPGEWPIVAAIIDDGDGYEITSYTASGKVFSDGEESPDDLVNVPEERELWVNVYNNTYSTTHHDQEHADRSASIYGYARIARLRIRFTVGQMDE